MVGLMMPQKTYPITMTCTEGREPSGLAMVCLSSVLGDVRRYLTEIPDA